MKAKWENFHKTLLYMKTYTDCSQLYSLLKQSLGEYFTDPPRYPNHKDYRLINMFSVVLTAEKRRKY